MGWNFNVGKGLILNDMVLKYVIIISVVGIYWIESDFYKEGKIEIILLIIKYLVEVFEFIILFCLKIIIGIILVNSCKSLSSFSMFYYIFCVINIVIIML